MDRDLIVQRLSSVDNNVGSIVGTATWCALHAQDAHMIVAIICDRLAVSPSQHQLALLYVLHEMLLSCVASATTDLGKRATLHAVTALLPPALHAALTPQNASSTTALRSALGDVLSWWGGLHVFPQQWLEELSRLFVVNAAAPSIADTRDSELAAVSRLLAGYRVAKEKLTALTSSSANKADVEAAREETVTCLNAVIRALNETSVQLTDRDMPELMGEGGVAVDTSIAASATDDVLGSFF